MPSGTSVTSSATARIRTASSTGSRAIGAVGVRGNHDAAACGGTEIDWFNPDARAAMEWTRRTISGGHDRAGCAACRMRRSDGDFTLVHGSAVDPTWEYVTSAAEARDSLAATSTAHGLNGHTHVPAAFIRGARRSGGAFGRGAGGCRSGSTAHGSC